MFKVFGISVVLSALTGVIVAKIAGAFLLGATAMLALSGIGAVAIFALYTLPAYRALSGGGTSGTSTGGDNSKVS